MLLILGLLLFVGLVVVHEYGHFLAARRGGVEVEEFAIGFPPKVWAKKMASGFIFSINLLPLGGFVKLKGEHDSDTTPGSFGAANLKTKIKIMLAGVVMNLVVAVGIFTFLAAIGMPKLFEGQFSVASDTKITQEVKNKNVVLISEIQPNSPAATSGLKEGDQIISLGGESVSSPENLGSLTSKYAGQDVIVKLKRNNEELTLNVKLNSQRTEQSGYLGVVSASGQHGVELRRSSWSAPLVGVGLSKQLAELTYKGVGGALGNLFKGQTSKASENVSGPVGIFVILKEGSNLGWSFILMIIGILSVTLAVINALPIPALDGGRLFVTLLFRALKRPLSKKTEEWVHGAGLVVLMALFVLITAVDIARL